MTISKAGELLVLPDSVFRSEAQGRAEVIRSLAGRARIAFELAAGMNPFPDEPAASPLNPRGKLGANLSGPPWGSALLHPIAWCSGLASTANVQGEPQMGTVTNATPLLVGPWRVHNNRFDYLPSPSVAPYSRGYVRFRAHLATAGPPSSTLTVKVTEGRGLDAGIQRQVDFTVSSTSELPFASTSLWVDLRPGRNRVFLHFSIAAVGTPSVIIDSLALHQIVKRSH